MKVSDKMDNRAIRGYSILAKGDEPIILNEEEFLVPSQSSNKKYKVTKIDGWSCECEDFKYRKIMCKHIYAVEFLLKLRRKVDNDENLEFVDEISEKISCHFCKSENIVRNGFIRNKKENKQRFFCKSCKKTFYKYIEFNYIRNPKIITLAFDLYFKGLSLRKITDTLNQFFGVKIHHETVRRWLMKFTDAMNEYTNQFTPKVSEAWHVDEQVIKSKGKQKWLWNCLDETTRFLIANNITDERTIPEAREIFQKAKETAKVKPEFIVTDGLQSYKDAILKEFHSWRKPVVSHVRLESIRSRRANNNEIERFHGTFRERDKTVRGFKGQEKVFVDGFRIYYNFIRKHQGLNGVTPSQKANLDLNLNRNR
jgi:transposase-like protein